MTEQSDHFLSIVAPVFDEEDSLQPLYEAVTAALAGSGYEYEIILVDDGSTDRSFEVMRGLFALDAEHVRVIRLRRNFGQTAALAAGFDAAKGDVVIPIDADLQNDPADIAALVAKLDEGYDVVSGWRARRQDPFVSRRLPSIVANGLISWITGVKLHDYGCTLKAYHRDVVAHMTLYGEQHRFLPALASWAGARVTEIMVNHRARRFGKSKYGIGRTVRVLLDLITVKFLLSYSTKPMQVFGKWGFVSLGMGLVSGVIAVLRKMALPHEDMTGNPWMYLCIFFCLGGLQLIGMGLLGEITTRTYYESQRKPVYAVREKLDKD